MTPTPNPAMAQAIALYDDIAAEYQAAIQATGVTFAPRDDARETRAALVAQLEAVGARVRNGGASIVLGNLSPACVACTSAAKSQTLEISNNCHRDCYFCFNPNQADFAYYCEHFYPWRQQLEDLAREDRTPVAVGLTGGEPLLYPDQTVEFFATARALFPDAYLRIYTSGDLLTEDLLAQLRDAGLDEIRFSVKQEDSEALQERVYDRMTMAKRYIPTLMVEMPIVPGSEEQMHTMLRRFDALGVFSVNLLEFTYPMWNWEAFASRGYLLKNPPFTVVYDYEYAGALAVEGSEDLCLRLMLWAHDEGLNLGLHYCSLENKHRIQMRVANGTALADLDPCYAQDYADYLLKTLVVFGADRAPVRAALRALGCRNFIEDDDADCTSFNPKWQKAAAAVRAADGTPVQVCVSANVAVEKPTGLVLRELKVQRLADAAAIQLTDLTYASDAAAGAADILDY